MSARWIIGGELIPNPQADPEKKYLSPQAWAERHHPGYYANLTGGGYYSLKVLLANLKNRMPTPAVLLPSYLCSDIISTFREMEVAYTFYPVDEHLQIDLGALGKLLADPENQVLYIIPWFGFPLPDHATEAIRAWKVQGLTVWEDRAQCLFPEFAPLGDAIFYSFRKFLPLDGSLLLTKEEVECRPDHFNDVYLAWRRQGQAFRSWFVHDNLPFEAECLECFARANDYYHQPGVAGMDVKSLAWFEQTDIDTETAARRRVYTLLHERLKEYALFPDPEISAASPHCFPVVIDHRDWVFDTLKAQQIFAPILWRFDEGEVPVHFTGSHALSGRILNLPVRTGFPDDAWEYMAGVFLESLRHG
ncbi:MAG TPA: hypothetical protein P5228_09770 [Bacteroidales bacterium]|nr:hypothetical protein [Bacteroidales bacterium]HRZ50297.1 hypothetical protein [Bacteroidales bacterium]